MPFLHWVEIFDAVLANPPEPPAGAQRYGSAPRRSIVARRDLRDYHHPEPGRYGDDALYDDAREGDIVPTGDIVTTRKDRRFTR